MELDKETLEDLEHDAYLIKDAYNVEFDLHGIEAIEKVLNEQRDELDILSEDDLELLANSIGVFVGECMVRNYNGEWHIKDNQYAVLVKSIYAFPIRKTYKFLQKDGIHTESISSFYRVSENLGEILDNNS
jgi:hypothetical protein